MRNITTLEFDTKKMADGMGLSMDALMELMSDARHANQLGHKRLREDLQLQPKKINGGTELLLFGDQRQFMVRCVSRRSGVSFVQSKMKGHRRGYDREAWASWVRDLDGFLIADFSEFPVVDVYEVSSHEILEYFEDGDKLPEVAYSEFPDFLNDLLENDVVDDSHGLPWEEAG